VDQKARPVMVWMLCDSLSAVPRACLNMMSSLAKRGEVFVVGQWPGYEEDSRFTMEQGGKRTLHKNVR